MFKNTIDSEVQTDHYDNNTVIKESCDQTTDTYDSEDTFIKPTIHCAIQTDYIFDEENKNIQVADNSETQTDFEKDDLIKKKTANAEAQTEFESITEKYTSEIEVQTDMNDQVSVLEEVKAIRKELEIKGENFGKITTYLRIIFCVMYKRICIGKKLCCIEGILAFNDILIEFPVQKLIFICISIPMTFKTFSYKK